jgi:hypothetical protein
VRRFTCLPVCISVIKAITIDHIIGDVLVFLQRTTKLQRIQLETRLLSFIGTETVLSDYSEAYIVEGESSTETVFLKK